MPPVNSVRPTVPRGQKAVGFWIADGTFCYVAMVRKDSVEFDALCRRISRSNQRFHAHTEVCPNPRGAAGQRPAKRMRAEHFSADGFLNAAHEPAWHALGLPSGDRPGGWEGPRLEFACVVGDARPWRGPATERLPGLPLDPARPATAAAAPAARWGAKVAHDCLCRGDDLMGWVGLTKGRQPEWWERWQWHRLRGWWRWQWDEAAGRNVRVKGQPVQYGSELVVGRVCLGCDRSNQDHHPAIKSVKPKLKEKTVKPLVVADGTGELRGGLGDRVDKRRKRRAG